MDNLTKLYRIRKTCLEMLNDRQYLIGQVCPSLSLKSPYVYAMWPAILLHMGGLLCTLCHQGQTRLGCKHLTKKLDAMQDELNMSKEAFRDRFGDDPRKDDLTVLAPKQDDPTDQVTAFLPDIVSTAA